MTPDTPVSHMPDEYDRTYGSIDGLPDVARTIPSTVIQAPPLGVGGTAALDALEVANG